METKHFSHHHPLLFHQVPQGSQAHCSGCKYPASGNVYACWQCSYFLHDQCFHVARSLNHSSHPLHPLTLIPFPTYPSASFSCNSCSLAGDGFSYSCPACEFDIHLHCALTPINPNQQNYHNHPPPPHPLDPVYPPPPPQNAAHAYPPPPPQNPVYPAPSQPQPGEKFHSHNHGLKLSDVIEEATTCSVCELELEVSGEAFSCGRRDCEFILHKSCFELPKTLQHKSHPEHNFSMIWEPPKYSTYYNCDACGDLIRAFGYQCDECNRRMHVKCAFLPESVECKAHNHKLDLYYSESKANSVGYSFFSCDVCRGGVTEGYWSYYCKECDFGTHLECATSSHEAVDEEQVKDESAAEEEENLSPEEQLTRARFRLEQQRMITEFQMEMARRNAQFVISMANSWKG